MEIEPETSLNRQLELALEVALHAAREAEKTILNYYLTTDLKVDLKRDATVVTEADREAEKTLRKQILKSFPDDAVVGEELGTSEGRSDYKWVLDPIDGTQAFVCGVPLFGTMIGLLHKNAPVLGVIHMPALDETFYATKGQGSWWRKPGQTVATRAQASASTELKQSLFCTTSHAGFARIGRIDLFEKILRETKKFRGWGGCHGYSLVATGRADLLVDPDVKVWDLAAAYPIVTEAGAKFFNIKGEESIHSGSGIACAPGLVKQTLALL